MYDYYDTEAAHLSEIYDDDLGYPFEPYTEKEKEAYIKDKSRSFKKTDVGKYVVVQTSRRNKRVMPFMYLVNRKILKNMWWSPNPIYAMKFENKSAAEYQAERYRYNDVRVQQITNSMANR